MALAVVAALEFVVDDESRAASFIALLYSSSFHEDGSLTDPLYADTLVIDCGHALAQIYFVSNFRVLLLFMG